MERREVPRANAQSPAAAGETDGEAELADVVRRASAGDVDASLRLYRLYEAEVRRTVRRTLPAALRRRYDSSDLLQSVFAELLEDLPRFEFRGSQAFGAWLRTKVRWKVRHRFRRTRTRSGAAREQSLPDDSSMLPEAADDPVGRAAAAEETERLRQCLDGLDAPSRAVIRCHAEEGLPFAEVAARLGLPGADAARMRYARALRTLARSWRG